MRTAATACLITFATQVSAAELKGANLVKALNGNTFDCSFRGGTMVWAFSKSDPAGTSFAFTATLNGQITKSGYRLHKNGSLTVSGSGIPRGTCVKR